MRKCGVVSGVVSCNGSKLSNLPKKISYSKPVRRKEYTYPTVNVVVAAEEEPKAPRIPLTEDQLEEEVIKAHKRHLKRDKDNIRAIDMTYHFFKHMGYTPQEWEFIQKLIVVMKEEIDARFRKEPQETSEAQVTVIKPSV